jgi:hypothetical protein
VSADLPPDVRDKAARAARRAVNSASRSAIGLVTAGIVVDAVAEVLAAELEAKYVEALARADRKRDEAFAQLQATAGVGQRLQEMASSGDLNRYVIQDCADALLGREGSPGSEFAAELRGDLVDRLASETRARVLESVRADRERYRQAATEYRDVEIPRLRAQLQATAKVMSAARAALAELVDSDGEVVEYIDGRGCRAIDALAEAVKEADSG